MKTKNPSPAIFSSLMLLAFIGIVLSIPLGCGSRNGSTIESYQTSAIKKSQLKGTSSVRFANSPERNPFDEDAANSEIATISISKTEADSCVAHGSTASTPSAETAKENELPTLSQSEEPTMVTSLADESHIFGETNSTENNPFAVFDRQRKNENMIDNSNRSNGTVTKGTFAVSSVRRTTRNHSAPSASVGRIRQSERNSVRTETVSLPTLQPSRSRWNDRTNIDVNSASQHDIFLNGVNYRMILDSSRIPRRIENISNPDHKRRRVFSPVPLKKSLQDRLMMKNMKLKHSDLYAELKKANFSDSQIQTIANEMMADEKNDQVNTAEYRFEDSKKARVTRPYSATSRANPNSLLHQTGHSIVNHGNSHKSCH